MFVNFQIKNLRPRKDISHHLPSFTQFLLIIYKVNDLDYDIHG